MAAKDDNAGRSLREIVQKRFVQDVIGAAARILSSLFSFIVIFV
jgi:hypothetical protein